MDVAVHCERVAAGFSSYYKYGPRGCLRDRTQHGIAIGNNNTLRGRAFPDTPPGAMTRVATSADLAAADAPLRGACDCNGS